MGALGEHLGLPWGTLESAIRELFVRSGSREGPKVDFGCIFWYFGGDFGWIFELFEVF